MKILVVEDEKILADSLADLLSSKGFDVETVYDGESGEEYALLGIYDLLILDVMVPKINGLELAK
ncbi:MAG: response regulator, partial [Oscillospiraceae bacterium]|nr:response regulator [Oscillospiraceae bacterium]